MLRDTVAWIRRATLILIAPLLGLLAPGTAAAVESCTYNSTTDVVSIATDDQDVLSRAAPGNEILFNNATCLDGAIIATLLNTDLISIASNAPGDQNFSINHSIGPFGPGDTAETGTSEVEIEIDLGTHNGGDILDITGSPNNDTYRLGADGINLNVEGTADDLDITGPGGAALTNYVERFRVIPGASNDVVTGAPGNQSPLPGQLTVFDGDGQNDQLTGGTDDFDTLDYGGATTGLDIDLGVTTPQDTGAGTDQLAGFERLLGSDHDDTLAAAPAGSTIFGSDGTDRILAGPGPDDLIGGDNPGLGDILDYSRAPAAVQLALDVDTPQPTLGAGTDSVDGFENLTGSPFADFLQGDTEANVITGGLGADTIAAGDGDDELLIRDAIGDIVACGAGSDSVTADATGVDTFSNADCELISFAPSPPQAPPATTPVTTPAKKKCKSKKGKKRAGVTAKRKKCKRAKEAVGPLGVFELGVALGQRRRGRRRRRSSASAPLVDEPALPPFGRLRRGGLAGPRPRPSPAPFLPPCPDPLRLRRRRREPDLGKFRSSSRATPEGLRAARMRAPRSTSSPSGVWATAAASTRRLQPAVLVARRVHQAAGVAPVGASRGVDQQAQQALGLGPALHRVLLVQVARVAGQSPDPGLSLVAAADAALGQSLQQHAGARAAVVARPGADRFDRVVEGLGVTELGDLGQRLDPQLRVAVALHAGQEEAAAQLLGRVVLQHRLGAAPARGVDAGAGERGPDVLLGVVEVLDRDPPQLALQHLETLLLDVGNRDDALLDANPAAASAAHGTDHDRAASVDVAVEQAVQGDDRLVVGRGRVDEVDDQARLLAGVAAGDAAHALLVDAARGGRGQVHADRRARRVPALGEQHRVAEHVDLAALEPGQDLGQLALRGLARDGLGVDARVLECLGDVVRVLDAGRVDEAGDLAEARLVEVGDRDVERGLVKQLGQLLLVEVLVDLALAQRHLGDRAHARGPAGCGCSAAARSRRGARPGPGRSARSESGRGRRRGGRSARRSRSCR